MQALLVTQLVGVIYARYVLAADPVATTAKQAFIDGLMPPSMRFSISASVGVAIQQIDLPIPASAAC